MTSTMPNQAPKVLSRRANGVPPALSNPSDSGQTKEGGKENNGPRHNDKTKSSGEKNSETAKHRQDGAFSKPSRSKAQNDGGKFVIRRLPPGLTQDEFSSILGSDWDVGKGKVDWFSYAIGKTSNDPSKPSRPGRAYLHLVRKDDVMALSDVVRTATWEDAKTTFTNPSLVGPPSLEFATYKKVPSNKKRSDARQGTIDQDPEFMAFLEELANPPPLRESVEGLDDAEESSKEAKVTTTPLVEFLKEKKANKAKDGSGKGSKLSSKGGKGASKDDEGSKKKGKDSKGDKSDKPTKEGVKILTKKIATEQAAEAAKKAASQLSSADTSEAPKNRRAGIAAAARLLQRDLGLSPGSAHRKARQDAAKADAEAKDAAPARETIAPIKDATETAPSTKDSKDQSSKGASSASNGSKQQPSGRRNRGGKGSEKAKTTEETTPAKLSSSNPPVLLKKKKSDVEDSKPVAESTSVSQSGTTGKTTQNVTGAAKGSSNKQSTQKKNTTVTPDALRAFIKHVNASQGITEPTLREALGSFGTITSVEVDKRKGFAYVDYADHSSLVKAVAASPVTIGQGSVQVLERKEKKAATSSSTNNVGSSAANATSEKGSGRGRRGRGGGGGKKEKDAAATTNGQATNTGGAASANAGGSG